eukprot:4514260-Prymnesium_polylepis.2
MPVATVIARSALTTSLACETVVAPLPSERPKLLARVSKSAGNLDARRPSSCSCPLEYGSATLSTASVAVPSITGSASQK